MISSYAINLLIADDHPVYRFGLIKTLSSLPMINLCHEAGNGQQAVEMCLTRQYHFVLIDIEMPVLDGLAAAKLIKKSTDTQIIILSQYDSSKVIIELLELGITGYISKNASWEETQRALKLIIEGNKYFTPEILRIWTEHIMGKSVRVQEAPGKLSSRQIEIIRCLCVGKTAREIADLLCISPETVNKHRSNIMKKAGVKNVVGLILYAIQHQIFTPERSLP